MKQSPLILLLAAILSSTNAFQQIVGSSSRSKIISPNRKSTPLFSAVADETTSVKTNDDTSLLKRDRYVATNRFTVRPGRAAKFEKRWGECFFFHVVCSVFFFYTLKKHVVSNSNANPCKRIIIYSRPLISIGRTRWLSLFPIDAQS